MVIHINGEITIDFRVCELSQRQVQKLHGMIVTIIVGIMVKYILRVLMIIGVMGCYMIIYGDDQEIEKLIDSDIHDE